MLAIPPAPATASWQKSTASADGANCVQVNLSREHVWVRDSKKSRGPVLGFTPEGWTAFIAGVQREEFNGFRVPAC